MSWLVSSLFGIMASNRKYSVKYERNNSKRWDGKIIQVEAERLEVLYDQKELVPGKEVFLPWQGKCGSVQEWNGVVVQPGSSTKKTALATSGQLQIKFIVCLCLVAASSYIAIDNQLSIYMHNV